MSGFTIPHEPQPQEPLSIALVPDPLREKFTGKDFDQDGDRMGTGWGRRWEWGEWDFN